LTTGKAALLAAISTLSLNAVQSAEAYPARPIRMVISDGPGSAGDILGRIAFMHSADVLRLPVVVDNRAGAKNRRNTATLRHARRRTRVE